MIDHLADREFIKLNGLEDSLVRGEHLLSELVRAHPNIGLMELLLRTGVPDNHRLRAFDIAFGLMHFIVVRECLRNGEGVARSHLFQGLRGLFRTYDLTNPVARRFSREILRGVGYPSHDFAAILHLAASSSEPSLGYLSKILGLAGGPLKWLSSR